MDLNNRNQMDLKAVQKILGGNLIWVALAFFLIILLGVLSMRVGRVKGDQVGIILNKLNGNIIVIPRSGTTIYNGITKEFYVLDKTLQTLEMTNVTNRGERQGKDNLKIKTLDGSDVYVDLKVQYRIDANRADVVARTSGLGDSFKMKWARDYIRSLSRNYLGSLTTEQFYDSSKRRVKIIAAKKEANRRLENFGIKIDSIVIPTKPHFYKEYEQMIKKKKLADQAVLEEHSKALAAKQRQETMKVEETNKKNVAIEQFLGKMKQKVISAEAEGERFRKQADAYFDKITIGAEARLYRMKKEAEAILTKKKAESKGIEALKQALEGEGGRNMVKMEYAKKLKSITITGKPFTIDGHTNRFEHLKDSAPASIGKAIK